MSPPVYESQEQPLDNAASSPRLQDLGRGTGVAASLGLLWGPWAWGGWDIKSWLGLKKIGQAVQEQPEKWGLSTVSGGYMVCRGRHKSLSTVSVGTELEGLSWELDSCSSSFSATQADSEGLAAAGQQYEEDGKTPAPVTRSHLSPLHSGVGDHTWCSVCGTTFASLHAW